MDGLVYIDELLITFTQYFGNNLTVKLFDGEIIKEASSEMASPFLNYKTSLIPFVKLKGRRL